MNFDAGYKLTKTKNYYMVGSTKYFIWKLTFTTDTPIIATKPGNALIDAPFSEEGKKWYDENGGFSVSISEEQEAELQF